MTASTWFFSLHTHLINRDAFKTLCPLFTDDETNTPPQYIYKDEKICKKYHLSIMTMIAGVLIIVSQIFTSTILAYDGKSAWSECRTRSK